MAEYRFKLFADYFQFYVQDEAAEGDLSNSWTDEAVKSLLALAPGTIGVGTVRNMDVPVTIDLRDNEPSVSLEEWDHATECTITISSGHLVIAGCTDYFPDAVRMNLKVGTYRARVLYGGLASVSDDGLDGQDRYKIILWPAPPGDTVVLKQWTKGGS